MREAASCCGTVPSDLLLQTAWHSSPSPFPRNPPSENKKKRNRRSVSLLAPRGPPLWEGAATSSRPQILAPDCRSGTGKLRAKPVCEVLHIIGPILPQVNRNPWNTGEGRPTGRGLPAGAGPEGGRVRAIGAHEPEHVGRRGRGVEDPIDDQASIGRLFRGEGVRFGRGQPHSPTTLG